MVTPYAVGVLRRKKSGPKSAVGESIDERGKTFLNDAGMEELLEGPLEQIEYGSRTLDAGSLV
jgi:hypothetical protein